MSLDQHNLPNREPLGITTIFGKGIGLLARNPVGLIGLCLFGNVLIFGLQIVLSRAFFDIDIFDLADVARAQSNVGYQITNGIVSLLAFGFLVASVTSACQDIHGGDRINISRSFAFGFRKMFYIAVMLTIIYFLAFIGIGVAAGLAGALAVSNSGGGAAIAGLAVILTLPLALWVLAVFSVVGQMTVIEDIGFGALGRSIRMTKHYRWPIAGLTLLMILMLILVGLCVAFSISVITQGGFSNLSLLNFANSSQSVGAQIVNLVVSAAFLSYFYAMSFILAVRLRQIKEGFGGAEISSVFE